MLNFAVPTNSNSIMNMKHSCLEKDILYILYALDYSRNCFRKSSDILVKNVSSCEFQSARIYFLRPSNFKMLFLPFCVLL